MTPLFPWPAGHLVPDGDLPLGRDVDLDHLQHAVREFIAALHRCSSLRSASSIASSTVGHDSLKSLRASACFCGLRMSERLEGRRNLAGVLARNLCPSPSGARGRIVVGQVLAEDLVHFGDERQEGFGDARSGRPARPS